MEMHQVSHSYKCMVRGAIAKLTALWNKLSRSPSQSREACETIIGRQLSTPVPTRWNSLFDAIVAALAVRPKLNNLIDHLHLPVLKTQDFDILDDYVAVMRPIAIALDKLQGEKHAFMES